MESAVQALHDFLSDQYRRTLSIALETASPKSIDANGGPAWVWQDESLKTVSNPSNARGAVVVDPEIGLCVYVQPFTSGSDIRLQIARALAVRSELVPRRQTQRDEIDEYGEWSVCLLWLVEKADFGRWVDQVAEQRQETAHFEEISVDAIVDFHGNWIDACRAHGMPRLLLCTRAAILRRTLEDTERWANADQLVADRLRTVLSTVADELRSIANEIDGEVRRLQLVSDAETRVVPQLTPQPLHSVFIEKFRNVDRLSLDLRSSTELVATNIIQGPNGTGKTSIAEALSIAIGGVSTRYLDFLSDSNEGSQNKKRRYLEKYLSQLRNDDGMPRVGLNSKEPGRVDLCEPEIARARGERLSGTFLSQSWSENLLRMRASDLGAQIAGNYSRIASGLLEFVEAGYGKAESERASFNKEWGLRSNVSRDETARLRLAGATLTKCMPAQPSFLEWVIQGARSEWLMQPDFVRVQSAWANWRDGNSDRERAIAIADTENQIRNTLAEHLLVYEQLLSQTSDLVSAVRPLAASVLVRSPNIEQQVEQWSEWLRRGEPVPSSSSAEVKGLRDQQEQLQSELVELGNLGSTIRKRIEYLDSIKNFVDLHWSSAHPHTCPICDSDLTDRNGIVETLRAVRSSSDEELLRLRAEYSKKKKTLDELSITLSSKDRATPPLATGERIELERTIKSLLGDKADLGLLKDPRFQGQVQAALKFVRTRLPSLTTPRDSEGIAVQATESAATIWSLFVRFAGVSAAPEAWKEMRRLVSTTLSRTMSEHLPKTIQALWWELAMNVVPAPWQYPAPIRFELEQARFQTEARLVVEAGRDNTLAAYILNGAELHNLGLAWFLTRYLTFGRFMHSFLVLDDPAYQMDQPTFRDFCRLLERLVRLHKRNSIPLTLVLFLHQDDRAFDAARATDATLHLLRWHQGTASLTKKIRMWIAPTGPKRPYRLVQA